MKIVFTSDDLTLLQQEAQAVRASWQSADLYPSNIYEEQRARIVDDYLRGAQPCNSEKQQAWLRRIKKELTQLRKIKTATPSTI